MSITNFDYYKENVEENKITGKDKMAKQEDKITGKKEEVREEVKKEVKKVVSKPLTLASIFSFYNTQTKKKMFFVWSQLRHMVEPKEYSAIMNNPDVVISNPYNANNQKGGYIIKRVK